MTDQPTHPPPLEYEEAPPESFTFSDFDRAFDEIIGLEGGYVHDPDDYGGETNWGISKRSYPDVDIKNLTLRGAKAIYLRDYWNRMRLPDVIDQDIAMELFEQGVNMGTSTAIMNLQKSLNIVDGPVDVDGVIGPQTLDAVNQIDTAEEKDALLKCLNGLQFGHYIDIVENNPSQKKFLVGWLKRIA